MVKAARKSSMMGVLVFVLLFYTALLAFLYVYQSKLMYFPDQTPVSLGHLELDGADVQVVDITTHDDLKISGLYISAASPARRVIVFFHGNAGHHGDRLYKVTPFIAKGYDVLLVGYRGYGRNPGEPNERDFYLDAQAYLDWLMKQRGVPVQNIILYGESLGTGVAVEMAARYAVGGLVLEAAYTSTPDIARPQYFFVPLTLMMRDQYRSLDKIARVGAPILFIHGSADTIIPSKLGRTLYEAAQSPKRWVSIDGGGHNDLYNHGAPLHVLEFLSTIGAGQTL